MSASYVSWRHKSLKKFSDGGKADVIHLTEFNILTNSEIAPYTLCGTRLPMYSTTPGGSGLVDNWQDWDMVPDGPTQVCKRCEKKDRDNRTQAPESQEDD